jgi:hypothetical protein
MCLLISSGFQESSGWSWATDQQIERNLTKEAAGNAINPWRTKENYKVKTDLWILLMLSISMN